ncbi:MAG: TdeIII family type II restriction endonuclease [Gaiellaceae bacterium]
MDAETRGRVKGLVSDFMDRWLNDNFPEGELAMIEEEGVSPSGLLAPFHDALVPAITQLKERSFSTRLGNLHERVAKAIARPVHAEVRIAYDLTGEIPLVTREWIAQRVAQLRGRAARPDFEFERQNIIGGIGHRVTVLIPDMDLFIRTHEGEEHYFEIKSPKANIGQAAAVKEQLMTAVAMRQSQQAWAWWGVPYNPYGSAPFSHPFAQPFFDFEREVMIGAKFWNFVAQSDETYEELLDVYREVGVAFQGRLSEIRRRLEEATRRSADA